jgi:hypothetical protein
METEEFWDDFAETYYEIQQESRLPIAEDTAAFLEKAGILPAQTFADVAGGAGRYLKSIASKTAQYDLIDFSDQMLRFAQKEAEKQSLKQVRFCKQTMAEFFDQTPNSTYEVVFSAMNPALTQESQLIQLTEKSRKRVIILRMIENHDDVFSLADQRLDAAPKDPNDDSSLMDSFERFLEEQGFEPQKKEFTYQYQEEISKDMMEEYYEEQQDHPLFESLMEHFFKKESVILSTTTITYRLLYWSVKK